MYNQIKSKLLHNLVIQEVQLITKEKTKSDQLKANHLNVKEKEKGVYTVSLKRKAKRADGSDNGKVEVVGTKASDVIDTYKQSVASTYFDEPTVEPSAEE